MSLTKDQSTALIAAAKAETDPDFVKAYKVQVDAGRDFIADWFNAPADPVVAIWRSDVGSEEIRGVVVWSEFVALTALQQGACAFLIPPGATVNATSAERLKGLGAVFSGKVTLDNVRAVCKRPATRFEALAAFLSALENEHVSSAFGIRLTAQDIGATLYDERGDPR